MVLLAVVWVWGWFSGIDPFNREGQPRVLIFLMAAVLSAWNLLAAVIAAGFFHAASIYKTDSFRAYRNASFRLVLTGILFLFPIPLASYVLGVSPLGRALSLFIVAISISAIIFGRARLQIVENRLYELAESSKPALAPIEEIEQLGEL